VNSKGLYDLYDCSSIGIQNSYSDYIRQPKEINTFAAISSFILGTLSMETNYLNRNDLKPKP
jgi:hypothetical protein